MILYLHYQELEYTVDLDMDTVSDMDMGLDMDTVSDMGMAATVMDTDTDMFMDIK